MPDSCIILLVEDNLDHVDLVHRALEDHPVNAQLKHVGNGADALEYLQIKEGCKDHDISPQPRLILLDLRLPKVDGLEVLRVIKADDALRQIPVVIMTTSTNGRDLQNACQAHANSYVQKPCDFAVFEDMIADITRYWLYWNCKPL